ncbi:MAG TPA: histidinol-phosphate transaminase [Anaeromyxobacteraceae bacterium]|nr:histidinol-phosphate transaminase [Anaeromyxobacteraceae bacterium]
MDAFKPHLANVAAYPYEAVDARIKLDQNESPEDLPADLKARALARLEKLPWNRYPSMHAEEVRAALARHESWPEEGIVVSPGSNLLIHALVSGARSVLDTAPAFPYYRAAATALAVPHRPVRLGEGFALPVEGLLAEMDRGPGVLFVPNPHGPTGRLFPPAEIEALAARAVQRGSLLVVDEAYHAYSGTDFRPLARSNPHVALLRTFSKSWRLGGIRAGYLLGSPRVAAVVQNLLPPFVIPAHTSAILLTVLESPGYVGPLVERTRAERERLFAALSRHPTWKVTPSASNFLLVRTPDAKAAHAHLLARGILVRRQDHYPGLEGCIRVSVGTREENDAFLAATLESS